jgi:hypothetical protein
VVARQINHAAAIVVSANQFILPIKPSPIAKDKMRACLKWDHQETFLTSFFGFIGISEAVFVRAEGLSSGAEQRKLALETALADVSALEAA